MTRTAIFAAVTLAVIAAFVLIASPLVGSNALTVDAAHWEGSPIVPCFFDAAKCGGHMLGTDENGRDLAARLVVGGGATITTAFLALCIELAIAAALTLASRYGGLIADRAAVAFAQGMSALPRVPLALLLALITFDQLPRGASPSTFEIAAWLGVIFWPQAFLAFHARGLSVDIRRRAIADLMTIVLVSSTVEFFGYGHMPPTPSWGNMLAEAQTYLPVAWWAAVFPGLCISLLVSLLDIVRRGLPPAGVLVYPLRGIRHAAGADMHVHGGADGDLAAGDNGAV